MSTASLEERIQRLEDIEAIKDLMARRALHVNKGWNGEVVDFDEMHSIFTEDVKFESADMQINISGFDEGMESLRESTAYNDFTMHSVTNPIIAIEGDEATGNWLVWIAVEAGGEAKEVFLSEDLTYVRTTQGWRIRTINTHVGMQLKP